VCLERIIPRVSSPNGALRILYVGTWTERKGLLRLLQALAELGEAGYELTIVGDAYRDEAYRQRVMSCIELKEPLKKRCKNLGIITDRELAEVYARHDVLVLPSAYEGYGMVVAEAARAGLGIICGQAGGASQAASQARQVEWVEPNDPEGLRHVLRNAIRENNSSEVTSLSQARSFEEFPTWGECVTRFRAALSETVSR
jgi:glycosyltransferase involved in cell wall biosynthesis